MQTKKERRAIKLMHRSEVVVRLRNSTPRGGKEKKSREKRQIIRKGVKR